MGAAAPGGWVVGFLSHRGSQDTLGGVLWDTGTRRAAGRGEHGSRRGTGCECVHRARRARVHRVGFAKRPRNEPTSEGLRESKRVGLCTPRLIERRQQGMLHNSRGSLGASPLLSSSLSSAKISGRRFAAHQPAPGPFLACQHSARLGHLVSAGQGCGGDLEPPPRPVGSPVMCLLVPSPKLPL